MAKKIIIAVLILFIILLGTFGYFYSEKPRVVLKKDLTAEINTKREVFEYIERIDKGTLSSKNKELDTSSLGEKKVSIKAQNMTKRVFSYDFKVLVKDSQAPTIKANKEISTMEGVNVDLLKGVEVTDNSLESIVPSVEGNYDFKTPGKYNLKYVAADSSGNKAESEFTLTVTKKKVVESTPQITKNVKSIDSKVEDGYPYYIRVNRRLNVVYVYGIQDGQYKKLVKVFTCSTGAQTPLGVFKTSDKYTWRLLVGDSWGQYATRITGHILFHSVPYAKQSKSSLKYWLYNRLGNKDSLGCIRLTVIDAKWLYDNCPRGTKVEIFDSNTLDGVSKPATQKISADNPNKGWDPTDPDPANPWRG